MKTHSRCRAGAILAAAVAVLLAAPASALASTVYAAASLREAFPALDGGQTYNFAGSNQLQAQIERGAPADVFAAASPTEPQALFDAGRCERPVTFATNTLVLIVPRSNPARISSVYDLRRGDPKRLAVGSPNVPIGDYTRKLLRRLSLTSVLRRNIVSNEANVASVTSKVALGSADAGFVYVTDARSVSDRVRTIRLPRYAQPPVRYRICVVRRNGVDRARAQGFIDKVVGQQGRRVLRRFGFGLPPRRPS